jgi:hypothetical protein
MLLMLGALAWSYDALPLVDRPRTGALTIAVVAVAVGWAAHWWAERSTHIAPIDADGDRRPAPYEGGDDTPAVVALLTNEFRIPRSAISATALDLAARGWIRISVVDDELAVVTRGQGAAGDSLRPYEQQVLNHLSSRAFNGVVSAGTLVISQHRLDHRWRRRFSNAVADHARSSGLCRRRYGMVHLAPPAAAAAVAAVAWIAAVTGGTGASFESAWRPRAIALVALAALVHLVVVTVDRAIGSDQLPTDAGRSRAASWLGYRARLRARIPADATVLAPASQQQVLAIASVMGVCEHVHEQLPVAPEESRRAWSEAGERPRVVRVRYPVRPGYGQHPAKVAVVGVVVLVAARWLRGFLQRVANGDGLTSLLDRVPGQIDLIERIASVLAVLCWIPIAWAVWSVVAGAVDLVATRERVGIVVRARRPADVAPLTSVVRPFADRERFATYLAVDDGRRRTVSAWLASERTAAPQGAQARVRATPLLGFVRTSEPVGTAGSRHG